MRLPKRMRRHNPLAFMLLFGLVASVCVPPATAQGTSKSVEDDAPQARTLSEPEMLLAGAEANRLDVVVYLLNKGLDPNTAARNGYTALIVAASRGNEQIVDLLLARGADVNKATDNGWTALMEAALGDQDKIVRTLLEAGARIDAVEAVNGQTPLIVAAKSDRPDSVTAMLEAGADIKAEDKVRGLTALHFALASTKPSSSEIAGELLVRGADAEHRAKDGYTPLMSAVDSGQVAKLTLVLSESVDVNVETANGRRALTIAAGLGFPSGVKSLLKAGAKVDAGSPAFTALTQAVRAGSVAAVKLLLDAGANPNRSAKDGRLPLMLAARGGHDEVLRVLLDKGADVNGRNADDGSTALMWAANNGYRSIVEMLIEGGADPSIVAKDGWTAGEAARMAGHVEIADKLERRI